MPQSRSDGWKLSQTPPSHNLDEIVVLKSDRR